MGAVRVAGVDGCRSGWVVVTTGRRVGSRTTVEVVGSFAPLVTCVERGTLALIAVDMPLALPDAGTRACDIQARVHLGERRSSLFPTPVRAVLAATSYPDALERSRAVDGRGLSKQAYNLLPKMIEIDDALDARTASVVAAVVECHPESCFATLSGAPLPTTKRTPEGLAARAALLRPHFPDLDEHLAARAAGGFRGAKADDLLDAFAAAEAARRHLRGAAIAFGDGSTDARDRLQQIVC